MKITIHCSDSDIKSHDDVKVIDKWHRERKPPFRKGGYHIFIRSNGEIQDYTTNPNETRRLEPFERGAHVLGHNHNNIGICLHGKLRFTDQQFAALRKKVQELQAIYKLQNKDVYGHNEFADKSCPNFDVSRMFPRTISSFNPDKQKKA